MQNRYIAIIPARAGSKRLKHKNILPLANKPLINWTVEASLTCKKISKTIVTSDSQEILNLVKELGVTVIDRPTHLASDTSSSFDALVHALESSEDIIDNKHYTILLQATSPLRNAHHIQEAIELLEKKSADAIISVCEMEHTPLWSNTLNETLSLEKFLPSGVLSQRSQDFETYFRLNGAIYICKTKKLLEEKTFFLKENIFAYIMEKKTSIDIDEEIDFLLAETIIKSQQR